MCSRVFSTEGKGRIWMDNFSFLSLKSYHPKNGLIWRDNPLIPFIFLPSPPLSFHSLLKLKNKALKNLIKGTGIIFFELREPMSLLGRPLYLFQTIREGSGTPHRVFGNTTLEGGFGEATPNANPTQPLPPFLPHISLFFSFSLYKLISLIN